MKVENIEICIVGLGYVGLPLAIEFSKNFSVVGFDTNQKRVSELQKGFDRNQNDVQPTSSILNRVTFTSSESLISKCNVFIITVPTPVDEDNKPNLDPLKTATELVGGHLKVNDVVIYESTVFPGCTEEICVPILEKSSKLKYNIDFSCGYSPERINPGDEEHTIEKIIKITSGSNPETSEFVKNLYNKIILAGTHSVSSIAAAEAAKVIENTQRDVNIALINELSIIFNKLGLNTKEILEAAKTKWNFHPFKPGLVGGHCIGVDPYYLTYKALQVGYHPEIILAGRRINDSMGEFISNEVINKLEKNNIDPANANIAILGLAFKENCPDLRNSKVKTIINRLQSYKCQITVTDECADTDDIKKNFWKNPVMLEDISNQDVVIVAVAHKQYINLNKNDFKRLLRIGGIVIDVKSVYSQEFFEELNIHYWSL